MSPPLYHYTFPMTEISHLYTHTTSMEEMWFLRTPTPSALSQLVQPWFSAELTLFIISLHYMWQVYWSNHNSLSQLMAESHPTVHLSCFKATSTWVMAGSRLTHTPLVVVAFFFPVSARWIWNHTAPPTVWKTTHHSDTGPDGSFSFSKAFIW